MARTRSEIREVPLSISFSRVATSTEAAILTRAARAVPASRVANNDSSASGWTFFRARSAASCHRSFCPWLRNKESIWSSRSLSASGSRGTSLCWMKEASSFSISDFWAGLRSRLPNSWLASRIFFRISRNWPAARLAAEAGLFNSWASPAESFPRGPNGRVVAPCEWFREFCRTSGRRGVGSAPASSAQAREKERKGNAGRSRR